MHNIVMKKQKDRILFRVLPSKLEWVKKVAYPLCKHSKRLCKALQKECLYPEEVKAIELAGFRVDYEETPAMREPFYTRGLV